MVEDKIDYEVYKTLLSDFANLYLKMERDNLLSIILYGSVARGQARKESDLDILIVLEKAPSEYYHRLEPFLKVLEELEKSESWKGLIVRGFRPYLSVLILSREEAEVNRYLFLDMVEEGKIIFDKQDFFKRRLQQIAKRLAELGSKKRFLPDGTWYWDLKPDLKLGEVFTL